MSTNSGETNNSNNGPDIKHPRFFFDNTLVVVKVENVLFNVHKYQLVKSKTFAEKLAEADRAHTHGESADGSSTDRPLIMGNASAADFECLLTVLYANHFSSHQPDPEASLIIPAFRLANKWGFADLRAYLMPLAEKVLDDVDKIAFASEFGIKSWLAPAHVRLCQRYEPLTLEEATKLGIPSFFLIFRMREQFRPQPNPGPRGAFRCACCVNLTWVGGSHKCASCNWQGESYQHVACADFGSISNTTNALTDEVNKWVEANGVFTESK